MFHEDKPRLLLKKKGIGRKEVFSDGVLMMLLGWDYKSAVESDLRRTEVRKHEKSMSATWIPSFLRKTCKTAAQDTFNELNLMTSSNISQMNENIAFEEEF
ncbi:unnamed protein product [Caenorhabditis brenneri]